MSSDNHTAEAALPPAACSACLGGSEGGGQVLTPLESHRLWEIAKEASSAASWAENSAATADLAIRQASMASRQAREAAAKSREWAERLGNYIAALETEQPNN
jgi:hypothetical protein